MRVVAAGGGLLRFDGVRGTHGFMAPEIIRRSDYNEKVDIWACGVVAYTLLGVSAVRFSSLVEWFWRL